MSKACTHGGCDLPLAKGGYCNAHYIRKRRGKPMDSPVRKISLTDRFWSYVEKTSTCWNWTSRLLPNGYGQLSDGDRNVYPHRVSYEIHFGPIPDGAVVDHMCHNPRCVNPHHLQAVTQALNCQNRQSSNNALGLRGVSVDSRKTTAPKYVAYGVENGRKKHLGTYSTPEEAAQVAAQWRRENFPNSLMDTGRLIAPKREGLAA